VADNSSRFTSNNRLYRCRSLASTMSGPEEHTFSSSRAFYIRAIREAKARAPIRAIRDALKLGPSNKFALTLIITRCIARLRTHQSRPYPGSSSRKFRL
jgi:hypothetical protein